MKTTQTSKKIQKRVAMIFAPLAILLLSLTLWATSANHVPDYTITKQDNSGNQRVIVVEVNSTKDLKSVFDDVTSKQKEDAGYLVQINCSTGETKTTVDRLANGTYAKGAIGAATTGLKGGSKNFSTNPKATCP